MCILKLISLTCVFSFPTQLARGVSHVITGNKKEWGLCTRNSIYLQGRIKAGYRDDSTKKKLYIRDEGMQHALTTPYIYKRSYQNCSVYKLSSYIACMFLISFFMQSIL